MSRYQTKRLPGGMIRVVDTVDERVDGVWNSEEKSWFNVRAFLDNA